MIATALIAAAAMTMPPPTAGAADTVTMPGKYFSPADLTVLVGHTVTWRNDDVIGHTVKAEDGTFGSSQLASGVSFTHTFDQQGTFSYYCTIHRQMRGTITVAALGLTPPAEVLEPGDEAMLDVLAPDGAGPVTLERVTATGAEPVGGAVMPDQSGHAMFHVPVDGPARFRARAGSLTSLVVRVAVAPRVTTVVKRSGHRYTVRATIAPAIPGATIALQRYVRERFDYLPVRTIRSKRGATATFTFRARFRAALRVAVTKAPGGWSPATSRRDVVRPPAHHQH